MDTLIEKYLAGMGLAWSPSTLRSEKYRLVAVRQWLESGPMKMWEAIAYQKPYSRLTTWIRVVHFVDWAIEEGHVNGPNKYKKFKNKNARLFKHVYQPKLPMVSFEEARKRIQGLADERTKAKALELLYSGMRWSESFTKDKSSIVGKGSKPRYEYSSGISESRYPFSYSTFLRQLEQIGLYPHLLRKLAATELARRGLREADLCEVMGWSSFATAKAYLAPLKQEELRRIVTSLQGGRPSNGNRKEPIPRVF